MKKHTVLSIFGTRPEAIKLAPVIHELEQSTRFESTVCVTAQHREMLDQVLRFFRIETDYDLNLMKPDQTLYTLTASMLQELDDVLKEVQPDLIIVQGDTTTTFVATLAAFYRKIPVAHVEAGLRTTDKFAPFPEEINRRLTSHIADLHFAPTERARHHLLREGIEDSRIFVTGNTVVDALLWAVELVESDTSLVDPKVVQLLSQNNRKLVLVTAHRREAFGAGVREICFALRDLVTQDHKATFIWPVHLNPNVRQPVSEILSPCAHDATVNQPLPAQLEHDLVLLDPVDYPSMVYLLKACDMILTDSGGIQEEAPTLGKPVLIMREVTERPEGIEAGTAQLVGQDRNRIVTAVRQLLDDQKHYEKTQQAINPFGDGQSRHRILEAMEMALNRKSKVGS